MEILIPVGSNASSTRYSILFGVVIYTEVPTAFSGVWATLTVLEALEEAPDEVPEVALDVPDEALEAALDVPEEALEDVPSFATMVNRWVQVMFSYLYTVKITSAFPGAMDIKPLIP